MDFSHPGGQNSPRKTLKINIRTLRSILRHSGNDFCDNYERRQIQGQKAFLGNDHEHTHVI